MARESRIVDTVAQDLSRRFAGAVPMDLIRQTAEECLHQWPDARINDFVPILATKCARERLAARGFQPRASLGAAPSFAHVNEATLARS